VGGLLFATLHTSNKTLAYGYDLNGNVTLLVDTATGNAAATYEYGSFGEPIRQSGEYATLNPYRFSTKYTDHETGLVDYGYRYYQPETGRWLSRDPIEEEGGINLYGFVENDGVNEIDYLGQISLKYTPPPNSSVTPFQLGDRMAYWVWTTPPRL
jgi:RHS repeat-associated protein